MKVIVGSENPSKIEAVRVAFETLLHDDVTIIGCKANSKVGSKPVDEDIVRGARNRNLDLYTFSFDWDYLISIEGGIERNNEEYYLVTYVVINSNSGLCSEGKSIGIPVTKSMYDYYRKGNSINKIIDEIVNGTDNKKGSGISGYLSDDIFRRSKMDSEAVMAALLPFVQKEKYDLIDEEIRKEECVMRKLENKNIF